MKTKILFLLLLVLAVKIMPAQKIDAHDLEFDYMQLPQTPVVDATRNYSSQALLAYQAQIDAAHVKAQQDLDRALAEYPAVLKAAKDRHNAAVAKYDAEMAAWKDKSAVSKVFEKGILKEDNHPRDPGPFYPPAKPTLQSPPMQKTFSSEMLATTYLRLDGCTRVKDNAAKITATLYGFEAVGPELKSTPTTVYNAVTKTSVPGNYYWYETTYKHPINLKVESAAGNVILDETFAVFNEAVTVKTKQSLNNYPAMDQVTYIENLQNKVVEDNMQVIGAYLNDHYGYPKVHRKTELFRVESKQRVYAWIF